MHTVERDPRPFESLRVAPRTLEGRQAQGRPELRRGPKALAERPERSIVVQQQVTLKGIHTSVQETGAAGSDPFPVDVVCSTDARPIVDAAIAAVRAQRVWAPAANRRGRLVLLDSSIDPAAVTDGGPVLESWVADAVASIARDRDLQAAGAQTPTGLSDPRFSAPPWHPLLLAPDGRPLAVAAASTATPRRRQWCDAVQSRHAAAAACDGQRAGRARPICGRRKCCPFRKRSCGPGADRQCLSRRRRVDRVERDDRRGLWILVLVLLALETWVRARESRGKGLDV